MSRRLAVVLAAALALGACAPPVPQSPGPPGGGDAEASGSPDDTAAVTVAEPGSPWAVLDKPYATDGTLPFFYDLYTFRGEGGETLVVASYAVRVEELGRERVDDGSRYRFNVGLTLADTRTRDVFAVHDSVYLTVPRPLDGDHLLHAYVETTAPPSRSTVQRVVVLDAPHPGNGQLYTSPYPIRDYRGDRLMISDVALGLPGRPGGWRRGDVRLALLPGDYFPGGDFDVFYEVYNLPAGAGYTTEIAFSPVADDPDAAPARDDPVRVRFTGTSDARRGLLRERRRISVPAEEGRYRMTVTVTDLDTGRTARRTRLLRIRHWDEDATLVPTCPVRVDQTREGC